jgi:SAM-dependent methyltransferase
MAKRDVTERFSGRADVYDRYRPSYPSGVLDQIAASCGLTAASRVADIGSGTGKLTELLLDRGATVYGVEPNADMRAVAERILAGRGRFHSVAGTAEATGLPPRSVDLVTAAQAFHWFDAERAREELRRILVPSGWVILIWNVRDPAASEFLVAWEQFVQEFSTDYGSVNHERLADGAGFRDFFASDYGTAQIPNPRRLDFEAVKGGYQSASYSLVEGDARYDAALARMRELFDRHAEGGTVAMPLRTNIYYGKI